MHNSSVKIDVLGFMEIWLDYHLCLLYKIPGYHMFTKSRNVHDGGVDLYISTDYDKITETQ